MTVRFRDEFRIGWGRTTLKEHSLNVLDLFTEALNPTDPAERAAFLDHACVGNPDLRRRLEELLAGHAQSRNPLDRPPVAPGEFGTSADSPTAIATRAFDRGAPRPSEIATERHCPDGATDPSAQPDPDATTAPEPTIPAPRTARISTGEGIGTVIAGRYTLVEVIGEGGMGSVYLATQTEPVKRQVTLKLIKTGMDSRGVLARFDAERQALALRWGPGSPTSPNSNEISASRSLTRITAWGPGKRPKRNCVPCSTRRGSAIRGRPKPTQLKALSRTYFTTAVVWTPRS